MIQLTIETPEPNSVQSRRLALIIAAKNLGIDCESLCNFLGQAIEIEEKHLLLIGGSLSTIELKSRERSIMEAHLIKIILEHF